VQRRTSREGFVSSVQRLDVLFTKSLPGGGHARGGRPDRRTGDAREAPGGAIGLRRRTHPGPPKRRSDPPPVDLRALTCVSTKHIARRFPPRGTRRAMPFFRPVDRANPALLPSTVTSGRTRRRPPPRRRRPVARPPSPESETRSAGCPAPLPPRRQIGCPITVPPRPGWPVARPPLPETSDLGAADADPLPEMEPRLSGCPAPLAPSTPFTLTR